METMRQDGRAQIDLANDNRADRRGRKENKGHAAIQARERHKQAAGGTGVQVWRGGLSRRESGRCGVERSMSGSEWVSEWVIIGRSLCRVSLWGRPPLKGGRKNAPLIGGTEADRQGSEGKCGQWLRAMNHMAMEGGREKGREGEITHHSMWTLIRISQDWRCASPCGCYSASTQPSSLPEAPTPRFYQPRNRVKMAIRVSRRSNNLFFYFFIKADPFQFEHLRASWGTNWLLFFFHQDLPLPQMSPSPGFPQPARDCRVHAEESASLPHKSHLNFIGGCESCDTGHSGCETVESQAKQARLLQFL